MNWLPLIFLCTFTSLFSDQWHSIKGREPENITLYRIKIPETWTMEEGEIPLTDTRLPICTLSKDNIRITIHNFPVENLEERIPPSAQVSRWAKQLGPEAETATIPQSFNGYKGILFEGKHENATLAWSLQLGQEHFQNLFHPRFPKQMRADITIKAIGPKEVMEANRKEIVKIARSFELIEEIPRNR